MERKIIPIPIRRTMRKSCVLLILALFSVNLNAQVTVAVKNQPLKEILKVIETKSEYRFFYNAHCDQFLYMEYRRQPSDHVPL